MLSTKMNSLLTIAIIVTMGLFSCRSTNEASSTASAKVYPPGVLEPLTIPKPILEILWDDGQKVFDALKLPEVVGHQTAVIETHTKSSPFGMLFIKCQFSEMPSPEQAAPSLATCVAGKPSSATSETLSTTYLDIKGDLAIAFSHGFHVEFKNVSGKFQQEFRAPNASIACSQTIYNLPAGSTDVPPGALDQRPRCGVVSK